jgi:hypothetical protein
MMWKHFKDELERIPEVLNMKIKRKHPKKTEIKMGKSFKWKEMHRMK